MFCICQFWVFQVHASNSGVNIAIAPFERASVQRLVRACHSEAGWFRPLHDSHPFGDICRRPTFHSIKTARSSDSNRQFFRNSLPRMRSATDDACRGRGGVLCQRLDGTTNLELCRSLSEKNIAGSKRKKVNVAMNRNGLTTLALDVLRLGTMEVLM
jgi:hypothetical protein